MINLYIKLNDSDLSFEIAAKKGEAVLGTVRGNYQKDLADKLIQGISDSMVRLRSPQVNQVIDKPALAAKKSVKKAGGLDKNLAYVKLKKRDKFEVIYDNSSKSFVSNLIANSVASVYNWLEK